MPPVHVSAPEFIRRLKDAQEGQVYAEFESRPDVVIRLFVTRPKESAGEFIAPESSVFESNEAFWVFSDKIRDLTDPPEEGARNRMVKKNPPPPRLQEINEFVATVSTLMDKEEENHG